MDAGNFTFQVSLHKNGDIWFVYKNVGVLNLKFANLSVKFKNYLQTLVVFWIFLCLV